MSNYINHKVKDIGLAEWGRREIKLAEAEMPGLISLRKEFGKNKGVIMDGRDIGTLDLLIEHFTELEEYEKCQELVKIKDL